MKLWDRALTMGSVLRGAMNDTLALGADKRMEDAIARLNRVTDVIANIPTPLERALDDVADQR